MSLVVGCLVMLSAGTIYAFSLYSLKLQAVLSLSPNQLLASASFMNFGLYFGSYPAGVIFDRYGYPVCTVAAALFLTVGYSALSMLIQGADASPLPAALFTPLAAYAALSCIGVGSAFAYAAGVTTNAKNFASKVRRRWSPSMSPCLSDPRLSSAAVWWAWWWPSLACRPLCSRGYSSCSGRATRPTSRASSSHRAFRHRVERAGHGRADEQPARAAVPNAWRGG